MSLSFNDFQKQIIKFDIKKLKEAYKQILSRFPDIHMNGEWKVAPNNFVHAIQEMPVKF